MADFIFREPLNQLDPQLFNLTQLEAERQARKIILIASESQAPVAVREALGTVFQNIYAEGYPSSSSRSLTENELFDYGPRLSEYRRYADQRYYKGVEYANIAEALAQRRCAELFATNGLKPEDLFVNVQPLSGAPANNAVYQALANPGDTIMGLSLIHGGHLTHGSPVNRSGKLYNAVHYFVDEKSERLDYNQIETIARENRPKIIIAGYSSYPWTVDWERMKEIAQSSGAYLLADIAHVAGLVAAGVFPSPVGFADIITFTTHKSLCGPRGACILSTDGVISRKIDRAVFPGEQGGPHVNVFVAMALALKLAKTDQFKELQRQIVQNAGAMAQRLQERGFRIPYGGTNTHMFNIDCRSVVSPDGATLSGDQASRILDIAGIVTNRNTIPGDRNAFDPSGIRIGTPWISQRGFQEEHVVKVADLIADLLTSCTPYLIQGRRGKLRRAKVNFEMLEQTKIRVRELLQEVVGDLPVKEPDISQFSYFDDAIDDGYKTIKLHGSRVRDFLVYALSCDVESLQRGQSQSALIKTPVGEFSVVLSRADVEIYGLTVKSEHVSQIAAWVRDISDGYVQIDEDLYRKIPGPIWMQIEDSDSIEDLPDSSGDHKPYFIGDSETLETQAPRAKFTWKEKETELRRTPLYETHKELGAKVIPFAGWEMPVWYSSVVEEHMAVREAAGLFDVAHMGVYQVEGEDAALFLDSVVGNDIGGMGIGESCYTHFLDPDANVIDDLLVYHRGYQKYMLVVNAANDNKDWAWLNAVRDGEVLISNRKPWARIYGRNVRLRNLRDPKESGDMRVDIALQGPKSRDILVALGSDASTVRRLLALKRTQLFEATLGGFDLVVSRTGYTGEKLAFELFVHPENANALFLKLLEVGEDFGVKPIGLGARDSLRTEAGLPLYGHEMGGEMNLGVGDAGFGSYVKIYKPWFIGRGAYIEKEAVRESIVIRFRFNDKGVRMAHYQDPVLDKRGRVIGFVTSCAVDSNGYLTGQAYLDLKSSEIGTQMYIYQSASKKQNPAPADLGLGERVSIPTAATVISRFP